MARFELHVWGAALGLESIDAECQAAITYFTLAFSSETWNEWTVVASNDPSICPSHRLPALHHAGVWTSGYHHIVTYLDRHLTHTPAATQTATSRPEALAYETYLSSRATALVDLLLFASATNWAATTRPAYSRLVGFPLSWAVPPALRADALRRVERFGFSDMDADGADAEEEEEDQLVPRPFRWKGLRRQRGVLETLTAEQMVGIRLCEFAKGVLEVLSDWVEKSGEEEAKSSTGCLVYACLALMIRPEVPRAWLRRLIEDDFGLLVKFYEGSQLRLEGVKENIPRSDYRPSAGRAGVRLLHQIVQNLPALGEFYIQEWRRRVAENTSGLDRRTALLLSGLALSGAALGYGYHLYRGVQPFGRPLQVFMTERGRHVSGKFGALGEMLGMAVNDMTGPPPSPRRNATSVADFGGPDQPHHVVADVQVELHRGSNNMNGVD